MAKKKILIITGTRAEYGLLKPVINRMLRSNKLTAQLLVTGIHTLKIFGNTIEEIKKDFAVSAVVKISENDSMSQSLSKEISGIEKYCASNRPDYIFVLGDRDEAFAGAITGLHLNIPVIHFSGGDVSGPSVDHYLRNAITIFSNFHFTQTKQSRENVIRLGADPRFSLVAGSLGLDGLQLSQIPARDGVAKELGLDIKKNWFLVAMHPTPLEEISTKKQIDPLIKILKNLDGERIIIYPNSDTGSDYFIKRIDSLAGQKNVHIFPNLSREMYLQLLKNCDVFIGNSSSGLTEAGFLKTPFVNIGNRQKGREAGANVIFSDYSEPSIRKALKSVLAKNFLLKLKKTKPHYIGGDVAKRVVSTLERLI